MKYLIRSLKYLIYFVLLFFVIVVVLSLLNHQSLSDISSLFVEGALAKISIIFVIIAAVYPAFGFKKGMLRLEDNYEKYHDIMISTMERLGYTLERKDSVNMVFRADRGSIRFSRMWEDAITFSITEDPTKIDVDGPYKDTIRAIRGIDYYYRMANRPSAESNEETNE